MSGAGTGIRMIRNPVMILLSVGAIAGCASRSNGSESPEKLSGRIAGDVATGVFIIVNADDVGGHANFTDSSVTALGTGRISSASVLAPGPDADRALGILKNHPEYRIGVHLTLTGSWKPLTPRDRAPGLYSPEGTMWNTSEEAAAHVLPEEARLEWEAQILKVKDSGVRITHLDSHMGCYFATRELFLTAFELAKKYGVPLIAPYIPPFVGTGAEKLFPIGVYDGLYSLPGMEENLENRTAAYDALLGRLPAGTHYLYTHHGRPDLPSDGLTDLQLRIHDFDFWTGERSVEMLKRKGIGLADPERILNEFVDAL